MKRKAPSDATSPESVIFEGDCVAMSQQHLAPESVDLIITDPPYGIAGHTLDKHYNRNEANVVEGYVEVGSADYAAFSKRWIGEAARVLRTGRCMFVVSGWSHIADVLEAVESAGLVVANHIIWKFNFGVYTTRKFVSSHYHIILAQKGATNQPYRWRPTADVMATGDVWRIKREYKPGQVKNKNQLPSTLLQRMILMASAPGDMVVDFFLGSGSTVVEAVKLERVVSGFELNPHAFAFASENLRQALSARRASSAARPDPEVSGAPHGAATPAAPSPASLFVNCASAPRNRIDLVVSQIPRLGTPCDKEACAKALQMAADAARKGGSLFFVVAPADLSFVLRTLYAIKDICEINHVIWTWAPTSAAVSRAAACGKLPASHLHVLFFAKKGGDRTFNRLCRFSEAERTPSGGSACYADMEDVWSFGEAFDEENPVPSVPLIQKIVMYCSEPQHIIMDITAPHESSAVYAAIRSMKEPRVCFAPAEYSE